MPSSLGLTDDQHLHGAGHPLDQLVGDRLVNEHARCRRAFLAGVDERRGDDRRHRLVEVGVGVDDHAVLAAELGDDALEVALAIGAVSAAARMISSPTGSEPVKAIVCTPGWRTSAAPASPSPGSSEIAAGERRPRAAPAPVGSAQPGDCSAGLSTTALPVASAAAVIPQGIASGKFHGEITAATPRGT